MYYARASPPPLSTLNSITASASAVAYHNVHTTKSPPDAVLGGHQLLHAGKFRFLNRKIHNNSFSGGSCTHVPDHC